MVKNYEEVKRIVDKEVEGKGLQVEVREGGFLTSKGDTNSIRLIAFNENSFNGSEEVGLNRSEVMKDGEVVSYWNVRSSSCDRNVEGLEEFIELLKVAQNIQKQIS